MFLTYVLIVVKIIINHLQNYQTRNKTVCPIHTHTLSILYVNLIMILSLKLQLPSLKE